MKPQLKNEVITFLDRRRSTQQRHRFEGRNVPPENLDELTRLARKMLMEAPLEVSKVKPLFWSMVETYVDRFHDFPFDTSKALQSYLDMNDYPEEKMQELVLQLEGRYLQKYGRPMRQSNASSSPTLTLDEELKGLRESLKYAAMVAELDGDK